MGKMPMMGGQMNNLVRQAQSMQNKISKMQEELATYEVCGTSGGGMVTAKVNGKQELLSLKIEKEVVNPDDVEMLQDPAELNKCFDVLHLYFNKEVSVPAAVNLGSAANVSAPSTTSDASAAASAFRYYTSASNSAVPLGTDLPADLTAASNGAQVKWSQSDAGDPTLSPLPMITWGSDSKEIIIKFAAGFTSADPSKNLVTPGTHFINLTGAKNNKNPIFYESGGTQVADGGEAAGAQILIKNYE